MGFLGNLFGGNDARGAVQYKAPELDQNTKDAFNNQLAYASKPNSDFSAQIKQGTEQGQEALKTPDQTARTTSALGGNNQALYQALSNKTHQAVTQNNANLARYADIQAPLMRQQAMAPLASFAEKAASLEMQNQKALQEADQFRTRARNQALSGLLGGIGAIGGAVAGSLMSGPSNPSVSGGSAGGGGGGTAGGGSIVGGQQASQSTPVS